MTKLQFWLISNHILSVGKISSVELTLCTVGICKEFTKKVSDEAYKLAAAKSTADKDCGFIKFILLRV